MLTEGIMLLPQFCSPVSSIPQCFAKLKSALELENRKVIKVIMHEYSIPSTVREYFHGS